MSGPDEAVLRLAERAARALDRPGAFVEPVDGDYVVRLSADRRRRAGLRFDEAAFRALVAGPGLRPRPDGGWTLCPPTSAAALPAGRPGVIEGVREVMDINGRLQRRRANLGESPLAWLARRCDAKGQPWLSPLEVAAGERLRDDFQRCGLLGRLTMDWSAGPKTRGGGRASGLDPAERAILAKARVRAALGAVGPSLTPILERVCLNGSALEAAERALGLRKRTGKLVLRQALQRLAAHYRMGV